MATLIEKVAPPQEPDHSFGRFTPLAIGAAAGILGMVLGAMELRWTIYLLAGLIAGLLLLTISDTRRFLTRAFVLSLQADLCIRFMYGKAGSAGIAVYLT